MKMEPVTISTVGVRRDSEIYIVTSSTTVSLVQGDLAFIANILVTVYTQVFVQVDRVGSSAILQTFITPFCKNNFLMFPPFLQKIFKQISII